MIHPSPSIHVERLQLRYGAGPAVVEALADLSVTLNPGQLTLISGPSGSGKTSLLAVLGCLLGPSGGRVRLLGRDMERASQRSLTEARRRFIGFVFQAFRLINVLSGLENVALASRLGGESGRSSRARAVELLTRLGLADRMHLMPDQLSGGEKQRIAIARALIKDPPIILADEPTASLDETNGNAIGELLAQLARDEGRTVVVVSHDPRVKAFADRSLTLERGRLVRDGSPVA